MWIKTDQAINAFAFGSAIIFGLFTFLARSFNEKLFLAVGMIALAGIAAWGSRQYRRIGSTAVNLLAMCALATASFISFWLVAHLG